MDLTQVLAKTPCIVINHTLGVEPALLAVIVAQGAKSVIQVTYVVTWNAADALADIGPKPSQAKKVTIVDYEYVRERKTAGSLPNPFDTISRSLIVFDSSNQLFHLVGDSRLRHFLTNGNQVIILNNILNGEGILTKIKDIAPDALLTKASFADHGQTIKFDLIVSKMTPAQDFAYQLEVSKESKSTSDPSPSRTILHRGRYENIVYPHEVQTVIEKREHVPEAKVIVAKYKDELLEGSPKFRELLLNIMLNRDKRHVIFTRYEHHHGYDVLIAMIEQAGLAVFGVNSKMTLAQRAAAVEKFNDVCGECTGQGGGILVTTVALQNLSPKYVSYIHMVDGSFNNMALLLDVCYKYSNYRGQNLSKPITINYYITQRNNGSDASSADPYRKTNIEWTQKITEWQRLDQVSRPIIMTDDGRFVVTQ